MSQNVDQETYLPPYVDSDEEFYDAYRAVNKAEPPVLPSRTTAPVVPSENHDRVSVKEIMQLQHIDKVLIDFLAHTDQLQECIDDVANCSCMETDNPLIEHCDVFQELEGCPLTSREIYHNMIKKKRLELSAVHYNQVVHSCMQTGCGIGKFNDPQYAKMYAYHYQLDYLSAPIWTTVATYGGHDDINPFFILEGEVSF